MRSRHGRHIAVGLTFCVGAVSSALAQLNAYSSPPASPTQLANPAVPTADAVTSANAAGQRSWSIVPRINLDLTHTDNARLQNQAGSSDLITRISPGILIQGRSARAKAYIDFSVQHVSYSKNDAFNRYQRALNASGTLELVDDWLYLDLASRTSRQALSAFGAPSTGVDSINSNVIEASMYQVSPYIKGRLGGFADYIVRYDGTTYQTKSGSLNNTDVQSVDGRLSGATGLSRLNWELSHNTQQISYPGSLNNQTDASRAKLTYLVDPQLRLSLTGGRESNDYINFQRQTSSISGWGFEWAPTERTQVAWNQENRYFGKSHRLSLTHRTPFTAWRVSDSRDVMIRPPQSLLYSRGTYYELLDQQFTSLIPNELERASYVQALLMSMNINPAANVLGGYMTSRATLNRQQEVSFTVTGKRNVLTFSAQSLERTALGSGAGLAEDDFSAFSANIRQRGFNANWSYKLTPTSTLNLMMNNSKTTGINRALTTEQEMYTLMLSKRLGSRTNGSIGVRKSMISGFTNYDENAVLASLFMTF